MAADDPFERRLAADLHALLEAPALPHPSWATAPAAARVTASGSGSRRGGILLLAAALAIALLGGAFLVAGGRLPAGPTATPGPSAPAGPPSPQVLSLVGQAPGTADHGEGPIVALSASIQPNIADTFSFWSWDPVRQAWTAGPVLPFPLPNGALHGASDGITVTIETVGETTQAISLAELTADASWRPVVLPVGMATMTGWALLARPAGGYVATRAAMLLVVNDDGTTRTAPTPAAAPIVMAGTSDPDWYVVTTQAGLATVEAIHLPVPYPAQLWNASTGALVPLGDIDDVAPADAGLAYVRVGPESGTAWQSATAAGLEPVAAGAGNTEIDPTGRFLFDTESGCLLNATAAPPRQPLGTCLTALPDGGEGQLAADGPVLWGPSRAFVTPARRSAAGIPIDLGLAMLSATGPRLIGFPPFSTRPATPTASPPGPTGSPGPMPSRLCATTAEVSGAPATSQLTPVKAVAVTHQPGYDQVVFDSPSLVAVSVKVAQASPPFTRDASGQVVEVAGSTFLRLTLRGVQGAGLTTAQRDQLVGGPLVHELVETGDFEGVQTWIIGLDQPACVVPAVVSGGLSADDRLVLDLHPDTAALALPDGLGAFAWATVRVSVDTQGTRTMSTVTAGPLGAGATFDEVAGADEFVDVATAGDLVAIVHDGASEKRVEVRSVLDGRVVGQAVFDTPVAPSVQLDPTGRILYARVAAPAGGVSYERVRLDPAAVVRPGSDGDTTLLTLGVPFGALSPLTPATADGFALAPDGTAVILACAPPQPCRVWQVPPAAGSAGAARALAPDVPAPCSVVGATSTWLIVYDADTCGADTAVAPTPLRAISLADGSSRLLSQGPFFAAAVLGTVDPAQVIVTTRSSDWSTSDISSLDPTTGAQRLLAAGLSNGTDDVSGWLAASGDILTGPWVLVAPLAVDPVNGHAPPDARLLDTATGQLIDLPPGTFGLR